MLPIELLEYLRTRLGNHSFSISHDKRFDLKFDPEGRCHVDSNKKILIPMPESLTKEELEKIYAFEIHETGHIKYDSVKWNDIMDVVRKHDMNEPFAMALWNQIEDYRVNTLIGYSHPGAGKLLYKITKKMTKKAMRPIREPAMALLYELEYMPYKKLFGKDGDEKLKKATLLVRGVVGCLDMKETLEVLPKVYDIFWEEGKKLPPDITSKGREYEYELSERSGSMKPVSEVKKNIEEALKKAEEMGTEKEEGKGEEEGEETGKGTAGTEEGKPSDEDVEEGKSGKGDRDADGSAEVNLGLEEIGLEKTLEEAKKILERHKRERLRKTEEYKEIEKTIKGMEVVGIKKKLPDNEYQHYFSKNSVSIQHLTKEAKKVFLFRRGWQQGYKTGKMNSRKVHRVVTNGDQKIFMKKTDETKLGNIAISILVDESASMSGREETFAREACVILHEVFRRVGIKHMIAGYRADRKSMPRGEYNTVHEVFKDWNDTGVSGNLVRILAGGNNRDGYNIRMATKFFDKVGESKRLLIIISDGQPAARDYNSHGSGLTDTVEAQREAQKQGIKIINVGIGYGWELPVQYKNRVKVDNVSELPKKLMTIVRKELLK